MFARTFTIVLNVLIWSEHATQAGLCALGCCLAFAACYREAPLRKEEDLLVVKSAKGGKCVMI